MFHPTTGCKINKNNFNNYWQYKNKNWILAKAIFRNIIRITVFYNSYLVVTLLGVKSKTDFK